MKKLKGWLRWFGWHETGGNALCVYSNPVQSAQMIVFDLLCGLGHQFEGWFSSAEDFAAQKSGGVLSCPVCATQAVERVPSATRINRGANEPEAAPPAPAPTPDPMALAQRLYSQMVDQLLTTTEDVGSEFPAEARRIFYAEVPARPIRGVATTEEHDALVEEGVPVARLPVPPRGRLN